MKSPGVSNFTIAAALLVFNLVLSAVVFILVMPLLAPAGDGIAPEAFTALQRNVAALAFVIGAICSFALVFGTMYLMRRGGGLQETLDAIRQPCLVLDENNRYALVNAEAERVLGLSRERDLGRQPDSSLLSALAAAGASEVPDARSVVVRAGSSYQVLDNPLPVDNPASQGRRRVVMLRDVNTHMRIRDSFRDIIDTMAVLNENTLTISETSHRLAQGAVEQATSLETVSTSLDEFAQKIQGNTETAAKSTQLAAQAREVAERSGNEIAHALSAMNDVQDAGIRIARIVKLIDDIAFQTNLLALNASVEAARAGRQGKGFAVVAEQVRNLAGRSAKAAKDTAGMVEDVTERIGNASAYISKLEEMLRNILQDAVRMADSSASASSTSAEQATAILQVNQELGQMNSRTHTTRSAAEQTAASVEDMTRQVAQLRRKLESFNIELGNAPGASAPRATLPARDARPPRPIDLSGGSSAPRRKKETEFYSGYTPGTASSARSGGATQPSGDDDFVAPFKKMAAEEWDLNADANNDDSSLRNLLRKDGFDKDYESFLKSDPGVRKPQSDGAAGLSQGPTEFKTTKEGDRVIEPEQNIHLDDSEFGRY